MFGYLTGSYENIWESLIYISLIMKKYVSQNCYNDTKYLFLNICHLTKKQHYSIRNYLAILEHDIDVNT